MSESVSNNRLSEHTFRENINVTHFKSNYYVVDNPDKYLLPNYIWCFSKSLPHDQYHNVNDKELEKLIKGIRENPKYLDDINFSGSLRLVNPSCVWSFDSVGPYKSSIDLPKPPSFTSAVTAGEMVELYNMALLRDVPFCKYDDNSLVDEAIKDLNKLCEYRGPTPIRPQTLFRGSTRGDLRGPYVSQFLYHPYNHGVVEHQQKYLCNTPEKDYLTDMKTILRLQNGIFDGQETERSVKRYITTLRDGATYVHLDDPVQIGIQAALILFHLKCPINIKPGPSEVNFVDFDKLDIIDLLTRASRISMLCTWYNKWSYLRLRPEALAIETHVSKLTDNDLGIHDDLLSSNVLDRIYDKYNTYLLPQAYSEGSPCHPAYPAGHSTFAGAMTTILKAFFDEKYEMDAFEPNEDGSELVSLEYKLRVGHELDKLASNIALFRDAAGVHYRSDSVGLLLGEKVAIELLKDHVKRYPRPTTFKFHKRNGKLVTISN